MAAGALLQVQRAVLACFYVASTVLTEPLPLIRARGQFASSRFVVHPESERKPNHNPEFRPGGCTCSSCRFRTRQSRSSYSGSAKSWSRMLSDDMSGSPSFWGPSCALHGTRDDHVCSCHCGAQMLINLCALAVCGRQRCSCGPILISSLISCSGDTLLPQFAMLVMAVHNSLAHQSS